MSYTTEAIVPQSATPAPQAIPIMREEKVVNSGGSPDRIAVAQEKIAAKIGQPDNSGANEPAEAKATEETVTLAPHVAALARKEAKFRQEQQKLKAQQKALEAERAEIADLKALKAKLAAKDYSGIESLVGYDEYTQYLINKGNPANPEQAAVKKLEDEIAGIKKSSEETVKRQFEAAVAERRTAVNKLVETSPEFARIKKAKQQEAVVQHILDTWEHDSVELSVEEAAKEVNQALAERAKQWAALLEEEQGPKDLGEKKQLPPMKQGIKTLTNNMTASDVKRPVKPLYLMSEGERYAEARRRAEEKLKQGR